MAKDGAPTNAPAMLTVGEGSENVQRVLIAEDALRHPMRNRLIGAI